MKNKNRLSKLDRDLANYNSNTIPMNDFFQCALSVDCVIFGYNKKEISVLLIKRNVEPHASPWALPGDFMSPNESLDVAADRVLKSLTGIDVIFKEQIKTFGEVNRRPMGRIITVSYYALVNMEDYKSLPSSDAQQVEWHSLKNVPKLAFDQNEILDSAIDNFRKDFRSSPLGYKLLPKKFTLKDVQDLHESVLNQKFDKANFRKKLLLTKQLVPLEELENNVSHRPAKLYEFEEPMMD